MKYVCKQSNQAGQVSILIVGVMMILLSLVVVGFSQLMNRELRQALDRQLSTQAFYSAESGVNDTYRYLASTSSPITFTKCDDIKKPAVATYFKTISATAAYTCILTDSSPTSLKYKLKPNESTVFKITPAGLKALAFSWQATDAASSNVFRPVGSKSLLTTDAWAPATGMLEVSLYPIHPGDNRSKVMINARTYYLYPNAGLATAPINYADPAQNGNIIDGKCSNTVGNLGVGFGSLQRSKCNVIINGVPSGPPGPPVRAYYIKITSLYGLSDISVNGSDGANTIALPGAQTVVDVTGRGTDVLRRVEYRLAADPALSNAARAQFGIQSAETICKRLRVPAPAQPAYNSEVVDPACRLTLP